MSSIDIPFTTFEGYLKQMDTNFKYPVLKQVFELAFSGFEGESQMMRDLAKQGIKTIITARGTSQTGARARRFAGDSTLPAGRYFTICPDASFNDGRTLKNELLSYYSSSSGADVDLIDSEGDGLSLSQILELGINEEDAQYPFLMIIIKFLRETDAFRKIRDDTGIELGETGSFTYPLIRANATIPQTIDLRLPETQQWFTETFVRMECDAENGASKETMLSFIPKPRLKSFQELLPTLISLERGGSDTFGQAVGAWLRAHGAKALIFPSARSNAHTTIENGVLTTFSGFNLVMYDEPNKKDLPGNFGKTVNWSDKDHYHIKIKYENSGIFKGSLQVRGAEEWNIFNHRLQSEIARGERDGEREAYRSMIGAQQQEVSDAVVAHLNLQDG